MARSFGHWIVATIVAAGCTQRSSGTGDDGSSSESSTQGPGGSESSSSGETVDTGTPDGSESGSTTDVVPACGNGVVEDGEQCDEDSARCVDCQFVCGVMSPATLGLTAATLVTTMTPPVALRDGSGDFAVASANAVHRVTATGEQVWVDSGSPSADWIDGLAVAGDDEIWAMWTVGTQAPFSTRLTRHAADTGAIVTTVDLPGMPSSYGGSIHALDDGGLLTSISHEIDGRTDPTIELRTDDAQTVVWSSIIAADPDVEGMRRDFASYLAVGTDGSIFAGGVRYESDTRQPLVAKLDDGGDELWQHTPFAGNDAVLAASIESPSATADGGVAMIAWRQYFSMPPAIGFFPPLETRAVALDADGAMRWEIDPTEQVDDGRVQLQTMRALDDGRFIVAGSLVRDDIADGWLGYLDADANLLCSATLPHTDGLDTMLADIFVDADGVLMVSGFADDDEANGGGIVEVRFIAPLFPY